MVLKKATAPKYWKFLLKSDANSPASLRHWFEMNEKFIDELQPFIDKHEEEVIKN